MELNGDHFLYIYIYCYTPLSVVQIGNLNGTTDAEFAMSEMLIEEVRLAGWQAGRRAGRLLVIL
jgi:hypothetical protein